VPWLEKRSGQKLKEKRLPTFSGWFWLLDVLMQLLLEMLGVDGRRGVLGRLVSGDGRHFEVQITGRQRATTVQPVITGILRRLTVTRPSSDK
jgi:hypothetical protein